MFRIASFLLVPWFRDHDGDTNMDKVGVASVVIIKLRLDCRYKMLRTHI